MTKRPTLDFVLESLHQVLPIIQNQLHIVQRFIQIKAGIINIIHG